MENTKNYPNPVKITNFSPEANAYRNIYRIDIDTLFARDDKLLSNKRYSKELSKKDKLRVSQKAKELRYKAKQKWRQVIDYSNKNL